jgi:hypothetical protein
MREIEMEKEIKQRLSNKDLETVTGKEELKRGKCQTQRGKKERLRER